MESIEAFLSEVLNKHLVMLMNKILTDLILLVIIICTTASKNWLLGPENTRKYFHWAFKFSMLRLLSYFLLRFSDKIKTLCTVFVL